MPFGVSVQGLAAGLGIEEPITSPTFALAQHYPLPRGGAGAGGLVHLDLYRLELPAAWLALKYPLFLERQNHPGRRLINELCRVSSTLGDDLTVNDPMRRKIDEIIQRLDASAQDNSLQVRLLTVDDVPVEQMIGMSGIEISPRSARAQIASALHVVVQIGRLSDGRRRLLSLSEIVGMEGEECTDQRG